MNPLLDAYHRGEYITRRYLGDSLSNDVHSAILRACESCLSAKTDWQIRQAFATLTDDLVEASFKPRAATKVNDDNHK